MVGLQLTTVDKLLKFFFSSLSNEHMVALFKVKKVLEHFCVWCFSSCCETRFESLATNQIL